MNPRNRFSLKEGGYLKSSNVDIAVVQSDR